MVEGVASSREAWKEDLVRNLGKILKAYVKAKAGRGSKYEPTGINGSSFSRRAIFCHMVSL